MILICSAWQNEIKDLTPRVGTKLVSLGIGYLDAALSLEKILEQDSSIEQVIFCGTAGVYNQDLNIGDLVSVKSVALLNRAEVLGQAYLPRDYESFAAEIGEADLTKANCLSSLEITSDQKFSEQLLEFYQSDLPLLENMELYGIAKVCVAREIPWSAILGITNYTNQNAHLDWQANESKLAEKTAQYFKDHL